MGRKTYHVGEVVSSKEEEFNGEWLLWVGDDLVYYEILVAVGLFQVASVSCQVGFILLVECALVEGYYVPLYLLGNVGKASKECQRLSLGVEAHDAGAEEGYYVVGGGVFADVGEHLLALGTAGTVEELRWVREIAGHG